MKASVAWQDFRYSNLVSTSTPQVRNGGDDESDGAEEDGFVGAHSNGPQEVMMEIMDKYVLAGEALAEKENDVRHLRKEVEAAKEANSDLETRVAHLTTANEKLADDEGRWYSLARELESQMDVIKKGETYSLFQDKVDEAEARLEVAADANQTWRKRLLEVYGEVNTDVKVNDNDGGEGDVDEHRQHATVLEELRHLKAVAKENGDALVAAQDACSLAKLAKQEQAQEAELRSRLEAQVSQLQQEAVARDKAAQSGQDALREAIDKQAQELRQALETLSVAETVAQSAEDARQVAVLAASTAEANMAGVLEDLKLARQEIRMVEGHLAEARAAMETSQEEARHKHDAQVLAESRVEGLSDRVAELESDLAASSQKIAELTHVAQVCQGDVAEATAKSAELQALADVQEGRCIKSSERIVELSSIVQGLRSQLLGKDDAVNRAQSEAEKALEGLQQELERVAMDASAAKQQHAAHADRVREELERATADAAGAEQRVQELHNELESTKQKAAAAAEENATRADGLRQELEAANAAAASAAEKNKVLRQELVVANATAALAEQEKATHVEGLREELDNTNAALVAAQNGAITSGQELERVTLTLADAKLEMTRMNEARMAAEVNTEKVEKEREGAETEIEVLSQKLALEDSPVGDVEVGVAQGVSTLVVAEHDAVVATHALQSVSEGVLRASERLASVNQAEEQVREDAAKLADEVRGLEAQLSEASASSIRLEKISGEQREALQSADLRVNQLEERLAALQAELDDRIADKATGAKRVDEESSTAMSGSAGNRTGAGLSYHGSACADVLFGSSAPDKNAKPCDDGQGAGTATANGVASTFRSAEAEELHAHAEAMELELRYTLESFEGQLSAMAREKVAIQKQVKELSGQCTTLRKQVSHYKKVAKENEAQVEQMLELQQQLCDAERSAEQNRDDYNSLRSTNRDLKAKVEVLEAESANETHERMWRKSQDEVVELRARLLNAEEGFAAKSEDAAAKAQEEASARALATILEQRMQDAESEVLRLKEVARSTEEQLSLSLTSASELRCALSKVSELERFVGDLEREKLHLKENTATLKGQLEQATTKREELQKAILSLEENEVKMSHNVQEAEEVRAELVMEIGRIATLVGCACIDAGGSQTFCPSILDAITLLKGKLVSAEELLGATAQALLLTVVEGEVEIDSASRWIIDGVSSLQCRLQVAEQELSRRADVQGDDGLDSNAKVLEDLSAVLQCDRNSITHKVHKLKKLAQDLSDVRDNHFNQVQHLKDDPTSKNLKSTPRTRTASQDLAGDELPAARNHAEGGQVVADSWKYEVLGVHHTTGQESEELRRQKERQQEGCEEVIGFIKSTNGSVVKLPCVHDKRWRSHRKSRSLQLGASSTYGWLSQLDKQGHEVQLNGGAKPWDRTAPASVASHLKKDDFEAGGDANDTRRGTDFVFATASGPSASTCTVLLAEIQAILGCAMDEVIGVLREHQAARKRESLTTQILGDLKHAYLDDVESLASAIGHEATGKVSPLLAQVSELWSVESCLISNREGLKVLHEATSALASFVSDSIAADADMAEVALRKSQEEVATLNETLRKERLMMMAFRRWGHFYLALSNEALRKRTKEQNQARSQRDAPEKESLGTMQGPRTERGRSRRSSSAGQHSCGRGRLQLSSSEVQVMVEQEAESVARELAAEPSLSLIALADARKEMDEIAMKAQETLGVLYAQSPLTHDAKVATDETMMPGIVEKLPDGKRTGRIQEVVPSPIRSTSARMDISHHDAHVAMTAEAKSASVTGEAILPPPMKPAMHTGQEVDLGGVSDRADLPEKNGADSRSGAEEDTPLLPTQLPASSSLVPSPIIGAKASDETQTGHNIGGGVTHKTTPPGRVSGPLVEDGISKKERADYLRRQREERKANRRREMQASSTRVKLAEPADNFGIRNRRSSAPVIVPSTADMLPGFAAPHIPASPSSKAQTSSESEAARKSTIAVDDGGILDRSRVLPQLTSLTAGSQTTKELQHSGVVLDPSSKADSLQSGEADELVAAGVRAPPPRMFNPTAVPPPTAPPNIAPSSQQSRHPSMAFNVNETVERALTEARRDVGVAERKAVFWRCRFRDLAVWAASFVFLAYASDHGFDC